jgi:hypothetical protein
MERMLDGLGRLTAPYLDSPVAGNIATDAP